MPVLIVFLTVAKRWKQCERMSTDEWINKMRYSQTVEYHSATEKNVALIDAVTQMNLGDMMLNRPVTRDKHYDHTY